MWIYSDSTIIEQSTTLTLPSPSSSSLSEPQTPTEDIPDTYSDLSRLRKRKDNGSNTNNKGMWSERSSEVVSDHFMSIIFF